MRHRAVLFGLVGGFILYAAFVPTLWAPAFIAGAVSVVSFLWLARPSVNPNPNIAKVFKVDIVALIALIVGLVAWLA